MPLVSSMRATTMCVSGCAWQRPGGGHAGAFVVGRRFCVCRAETRRKRECRNLEENENGVEGEEAHSACADEQMG